MSITPTLDRANEVRLARATLKRDLRSGRVNLRAALAEPCAASWSVYDLLRHLPRMGPSRAADVLREQLIGVTRRCGELTDRQAAALVYAVACRRPPRRAVEAVIGDRFLQPAAMVSMDLPPLLLRLPGSTNPARPGL